MIRPVLFCFSDSVTSVLCASMNLFGTFETDSVIPYQKFIFFKTMRPFPRPGHLISVSTKKPAGRKDIMKKEQLGHLILASEETLYHVAKSLLASDADCADAIQEAIVKAFTNLHTLRQDSYATTWLVRILINECYTLMRRGKRLGSLEESQYQ